MSFGHDRSQLLEVVEVERNNNAPYEQDVPQQTATSS